MLLQRSGPEGPMPLMLRKLTEAPALSLRSLAISWGGILDPVHLMGPELAGPTEYSISKEVTVNANWIGTLGSTPSLIPDWAAVLKRATGTTLSAEVISPRKVRGLGPFSP